MMERQPGLEPIEMQEAHTLPTEMRIFKDRMQSRIYQKKSASTPV